MSMLIRRIPTSKRNPSSAAGAATNVTWLEACKQSKSGSTPTISSMRTSMSSASEDPKWHAAGAPSKRAWKQAPNASSITASRQSHLTMSLTIRKSISTSGPMRCERESSRNIVFSNMNARATPRHARERASATAPPRWSSNRTSAVADSTRDDTSKILYRSLCHCCLDRLHSRASWKPQVPIQSSSHAIHGLPSVASSHRCPNGEREVEVVLTLAAGCMASRKASRRSDAHASRNLKAGTSRIRKAFQSTPRSLASPHRSEESRRQPRSGGKSVTSGSSSRLSGRAMKSVKSVSGCRRPHAGRRERRRA
mmetsp:Transcript_50019/g.112423  ORF Transcript_50019/g.112423 Transcript_50019/m.112423 type:complete len:310 (+) Transcript_50019:763-1692(+)